MVMAVVKLEATHSCYYRREDFIRQDSALQYVDESLRRDRDFVLAIAPKLGYWVLRYCASDDLKP